MTQPSIRDYGDRGLMIECGSTTEVLALADALRSARLPMVEDIVAGARTVLVHLGAPGLQASVRSALADIHPNDSHSIEQSEVVIDVVYDGTDLAEVGAAVGMDVEGIVQAHTGTRWRVGFGGFTPGFAYLIGGDERLVVPRRSEPRTRVPAGAVALAGEFSGIYPRESPGGWQLIGRTAATLWDIGRSPPALLTPGMWVKFRAVDPW